jgi:hypothetical protein
MRYEAHLNVMLAARKFPEFIKFPHKIAQIFNHKTLLNSFCAFIDTVDRYKCRK